jgi:hypothetical protein
MWAPPASASAASEPIAIASRLISFIPFHLLADSGGYSDLTPMSGLAPDRGTRHELSGEPHPADKPSLLPTGLAVGTGKTFRAGRLVVAGATRTVNM